LREEKILSKKKLQKKTKTPKKKNFGKCSYHLCNNKMVKLYRCKYCGDYFCHEHLDAKIPQTAPFKSTNIERHIEWEKKGGHPCFPYFEYRVKKDKEKKVIPVFTTSKITKEVEPKTEYLPLPVIKDHVKPQKQGEKTKKKPIKTSKLKFEPESINKKELLAETKPEMKKEFKISEYSSYYFHKFKRWFLRKKNPHSKLRWEDFALQLSIFIGLSLIFWVIYTNSNELNKVVLWIFKLAAIIQIFLFILIIRNLYKLLKNLKFGIKGSSNGVKFILVIIFLLLCLRIYQKPSSMLTPITEFDYDTFNPIEIDLNFSDITSTDNNNDYNNDSNKDINDSNQEEESKPNIYITELEQEIHNSINIERQNHGLSALEWDSKLSDIARSHSQDMSNRNYFDHYTPEGKGPTERAKAAGYNCYKNFGSYYTDGIAENIHMGWLYSEIIYGWETTYNWYTQSEIAFNAVNGWMNSLGHRENILTSTYDKEGIGIAISNDYAIYVTQDFW